MRPLRIAYLVTAFPVISEAPFLNQITGLVERGHHVDIFAVHPERGGRHHADVDRLGLLRRTYYPPAPPAGVAARWAGALELLWQHRNHGGEILRRSLNVRQFGRQASSLRLLYSCVPFLPGRVYDIIQACFGPDGIKAERLRSVGAVRGRIVTSFRGHDVTQYVERNGIDVYRPLFARGELFLPVSQGFAARLEAMGCPADRIAVHRTGIAVGRIPFSPKLPWPDEPLRLISAARLVEKKGLDVAIRAVGILTRAGVNVEYTILGDGPLHDELLAMVSVLELEGRVHLPGTVAYPAVLEHFSRSHVLLAPSLVAESGDQEGIPNAIKEGMAAGLPVITTNHGGIPELVQDGITGWVVPERDADALAAAVQRIAEAPEASVPIAVAARRAVEKDYDIERLNDRLVQRYWGVVNGGGAGTRGSGEAGK
ncbi:MAG TPA: glycosyltransferase [Gemmatimonadales bacterium]|nr:glycosyltransferase [Gemmatimonadales bacterium]